MCTETINETINVCKYIGYEKKTRTIEGEVVIQDIKPDILSIVKISKKICIAKKTIEDNKVRLDGTVDICIVYIADDETNSVRGVNSQIGFSEVLDFKGIDEKTILKMKYSSNKVEYKVINGRKISIRCPITFDMKAFKNCDVNIIKGITNDEKMQFQKVEKNICGPINQSNTNVEIKENIKLNDENLPISEILDSSISIKNKEYKISYNKILAKAEACVKIIYIADNEKQNIETFETTLPVMGFIDVDGINENNEVVIDYEIKDFSVRPVYQDLQSNAILIESDIDVTTYSYETRNIELVTDFYTPNSILKVENENINILKRMIDKEDKIEIIQDLVVPELDNTNILNIDGAIELNEKNILDGKVAITGNIDVNIFYAKNDSHIVENKKLELPFQQVIKIDDINKNMSPIVHIHIEDIEYKKSGENQLQVVVKLVVTIISDEEIEINSVTKLEVSDEKVPDMPSIVIYYVKHGDSLWNIAKKFRSTVDYIKEVNELKDDMIYSGQRLLIPRLYEKDSVSSLM